MNTDGDGSVQMSREASVDQGAREGEGRYVTANGKRIEARVPCSIAEFLVAQRLLPGSVVVEQNGEAVAPSEFAGRQVRGGDRLEIVKIVAGG